MYSTSTGNSGGTKEKKLREKSERKGDATGLINRIINS